MEESNKPIRLRKRFKTIVEKVLGPIDKAGANKLARLKKKIDTRNNRINLFESVYR